MPWQCDVFERAFELDPATGLLWYGEIVLIIPRQSGKTTLTIPWGVHRAVTWPERQRIVYTAQTRDKALEKLLDEVYPMISGSPFRHLLRPNHRGQLKPFERSGNEHFKFLDGSRWGIDAPTEKAGHGGSLHLTVSDEMFALPDARLEAAFAPTTTAVPDSQSLWISTVGKSKAASPFMWDKVAIGRNRVELARADPSLLKQHRTLFVEFSAPDDADWRDPRVWWETMPALGYTTTEAKIAAFADQLQANDGVEFRRPFLNQWLDDIATASAWIIPEDKWTRQRDPASSIPDGAPLLWSVDVTPERTWASISVAGVRADGKFHIEVVSDGAGTAWLIEGDEGRGLKGLRGLIARNGGEVVYDPQTTAALRPDLDDAGIVSTALNALTISTAPGSLLDYVLNGRVWHIGQQTELTDQLAHAKKAIAGDGWKWSRGRSGRPITGLVAVSNAVRALAERLPDLMHDPLDALRGSAN